MSSQCDDETINLLSSSPAQTPLHGNGNKEKVQLNQSSILATVPGKDMAFVEPIGSSNNVSSEDLSEWLDQENTLADWNHLFFLAEWKIRKELSHRS